MLKAVCASLLFTTLVFAQDPDQRDKKPDESQEALAGKAQFKQTCGFCHGANARGASAPDLIHSTLVIHDVHGDLIGQVVRNGRPDKGMPAFQLSDSQIHALSEYLHSEAHLASTTYQRGPGDYPVEKLLVGNAEAGKRYFEGAGRCSQCHSVSGDLAHIATKYKPIDLQSRIAYPSGAVPAVTVTESSGKVATGSEVYVDEFTVSLKDKNGWVHSWNPRLVKVSIDDPLAAHVSLLAAYTDSDLHNLFAYLETLK